MLINLFGNLISFYFFFMGDNSWGIFAGSQQAAPWSFARWRGFSPQLFWNALGLSLIMQFRGVALPHAGFSTRQHFAMVFASIVLIINTVVWKEKRKGSFIECKKNPFQTLRNSEKKVLTKCVYLNIVKRGWKFAVQGVCHLLMTSRWPPPPPPLHAEWLTLYRVCKMKFQNSTE